MYRATSFSYWHGPLPLSLQGTKMPTTLSYTGQSYFIQELSYPKYQWYCFWEIFDYDIIKIDEDHHKYSRKCKVKSREHWDREKRWVKVNKVCKEKKHRGEGMPSNTVLKRWAGSFRSRKS